MKLKYIATDVKTGKKIRSSAEAQDVPSLVDKLYAQGLLPIKVYQGKLKGQSWQSRFVSRSGTIKNKEIVIFTRQLGATLRAGLLLTEALETLKDESDNAYFRKILDKVVFDVKSGSTFSTALAQFPAVFPLSYTSIIRTGEATGRLDKTIESLAKYLEDVERLREKVKSAMHYPLFVFGFALFIVGVMVVFLIPRFKEIYSQVGAQLPWVTLQIVRLSDFIINYYILLILMVVVFLILAKFFVEIPGVKFHLDYLKFKIPILGRHIIHKSVVSRFVRTLGFLLSGGVPIATSLDIAAKVVNNRIAEKAINRIKTRVLGGSSLTDAIKEHKVFPRLVSKMSSVGEKTGAVSEMFNRTADYYDEEIDIAVHNLTVMIEPVMIIVVGLIIAIVIVALYMPIFQVSTLVQ